jgi:hypothetical protein
MRRRSSLYSVLFVGPLDLFEASSPNEIVAACVTDTFFSVFSVALEHPSVADLSTDE